MIAALVMFALSDRIDCAMYMHSEVQLAANSSVIVLP
jgi:hypothetical protein